MSSVPAATSPSTHSAEAAEAGQAVYNPRVLKFYDLLVHGFSNRWLWKMPTAMLLKQYDEHLTGNHLDVGVGSGYFLDRARFPMAPRVGLMDLNAHSLRFASERVARFSPETYVANVLEPLEEKIAPFSSISMTYLLHCLPGSMTSKSVVFETLQPLLLPGAVLFGATLMQGKSPRNKPAQKLMDVYNRKGIFSNTEDDLPELEAALGRNFAEYGVTRQGVGALFWARTAG